MGTSSYSSTRKEKRGFSAEDVTNFMRSGMTQSTSSTYDETNKPKEKVQTTVTERESSSGIFSLFNGPDSKTVHTSGFMGGFSDITQEKIDAMSSSFLQRGKSIKQRSGSFGRAGLLLER